MNPDNIKYSKSHEWVKLDEDIATIGISDFAQQELTDIVYVDLPPVGKNLVAGKEFGVIESVKTASDLYSPVSGTVIKINSQLETQPDLVNKEPYGNGWLIKVKCQDIKGIDALLSAKDYTELTESK